MTATTVMASLQLASAECTIPKTEGDQAQQTQLLERLAATCEVAEATRLAEAAELRHRTLEVICQDPAAGIDIDEHPA